MKELNWGSALSMRVTSIMDESMTTVELGQGRRVERLGRRRSQGH